MFESFLSRSTRCKNRRYHNPQTHSSINTNAMPPAHVFAPSLFQFRLFATPFSPFFRKAPEWKSIVTKFFLEHNLFSIFFFQKTFPFCFLNLFSTFFLSFFLSFSCHCLQQRLPLSLPIHLYNRSLASSNIKDLPCPSIFSPSPALIERSLQCPFSQQQFTKLSQTRANQCFKKRQEP